MAYTLVWLLHEKTALTEKLIDLIKRQLGGVVCENLIIVKL